MNWHSYLTTLWNSFVFCLIIEFYVPLFGDYWENGAVFTSIALFCFYTLSISERVEISSNFQFSSLQFLKLKAVDKHLSQRVKKQRYNSSAEILKKIYNKITTSNTTKYTKSHVLFFFPFWRCLGDVISE